jgi:spore germination protein KA
MINENIIRPLMYDSQFIISPNEAEAFSMDDIYSNLLSVGSAEYAADLYDAAYGCLSGDAAFFAEGSDQALLLCCKGWKERSVEDPQTESVIRGPREGFTEDIRTNSSLLRRKIRDPALRLETMKIGRKTATKVTVAYLQGVAPPELIEETKYRLGRIDTDAILESGYIEQYIEDAPFSIFATVAYSEKPDVVAAKILEGRAAILVDGTPFVLTVPMLFAENFQTSEDYYVRTYYASILRLIRYLSYAITILAPAAYVALTTFHQELIPTALLFTMIAAREGIPFPAIMEAGLMIITFEIIREAGVRLPRPVGQAISIVGALVIGESAVSAGLIGAPMVIVVALTAVSSFVLPANTENDVILRIVFLILAGSMGGFGIMIGLLGLLIHLSSLRSFGTPYLSPVIPLRQENMQDVFIRKPLWSMKRRPFGIARGNINRRMDVSPPPPSPENRNCP